MATAPPRRRNRAPSEAEWKRIEGIVKRLYIKDKLPLKEIARILEQDHNFHAAPHMYKHRMKNWNFKKNYKREELAAVADSAQCFVRAGIPLPATLHSLVPVQRAKRHFPTLFEKSCHPNSSDSSNGRDGITRTRPTTDRGSHPTQNPSGRNALMPMTTLHHSNELRDLEAILMQVNNYFQWSLRKDSPLRMQPAEKTHMGTPPAITPKGFLIDIYQRCSLIANGITEAAAALVTTVRRDTVNFLRKDSPGLAMQLRSNTYSYIGTVSRRILGEAHPVTMILALASRSGGFVPSSHLVLQLMYDLALRQADSRSRLAAEIGAILVETITEECDFESASELCRRALRRRLKHFGHNSYYYRHLLCLYGRLHFLHGFNDEAEKIFHNVLLLNGFADEEKDCWQMTMSYLGCIWEKRMDWGEAHDYYAQAYDSANEAFGSDDPSTQTCLQDLRRVQAKQAQESRGLHSVSENNAEDCLQDVMDKFAELQQEMEQLDLDEEDDEVPAERDMPWNVKRAVVEDITGDLDDHDQSSLEQPLSHSESPGTDADADTDVDQSNFDQEIAKSQQLLSMEMGEIRATETLTTMEAGNPQDEAHVSNPLDPVFMFSGDMLEFELSRNGETLLDDIPIPIPALDMPLLDEVPVLDMRMDDLATMPSDVLPHGTALGMTPDLPHATDILENMNPDGRFESRTSRTRQWHQIGQGPDSTLTL
ncbi:hypothetical protein A1O3_02127 [Capronia epimyces CBS 606.96]|uniref:Clr5 domain-containing protein n=1 Tax=Capronia epimyces CBS 606.96 TaxID=1182542 RepID=W9Y946_9EURO|nr:uncharacterized protein A1O3_02127 [Capronia epimyces CBS 606.96]EXJ89063.1 hypothetical protein A1O3_02127 [Capronia epimyces CBS 606.96]